jgi:hypothetical protein
MTLAGVCTPSFPFPIPLPLFPCPNDFRGLLSNITEYYFVWIAVDFISGILWFFFSVETVGRTIEELDACFEAKFPPRASWKRTKMLGMRPPRLVLRPRRLRHKVLNIWDGIVG